MQNPLKDWLVRTKTGEVLGPFTQRELIEELRKKTFSTDDEIAQSQNMWISAQTLTAHEPDEFTLTHTRNQTAITQTTNTDSLAGRTAPYGESPAFFSSKEPSDTLLKGHEEKSPTLKFFPGSKPGPVVVIVVTTLLALILGVQFKHRHSSPSPQSENSITSSVSSDPDSPFVKQIYAMIHQGETQAALRELNQYHEHHPATAAPDYLIPYASLLITEGDSPIRAKKFLEQVLRTESATAFQKSHAHHWLGYIQLSENSDDLGETHFLDSIRMDPSHAPSFFNLGRTYLKQKKFAQALGYLNKVTVDPGDAWLVYIYKGRAKAALGEMEEARVMFRNAMEKAPDRWITYLYYAIFLSATREHHLAQEVMKKMLLRDPQYESDSPTPLGFFQEKVSWAEYLDTYIQIMEDTDSETRDIGKLYLSYLLSNNGLSEGKRLEAVGEKGNTLARLLALKAQLDREASSKILTASVDKLNGSLKDFGYYAYVLRGEAKSRLGRPQEANKDFQAALILEPQAAVAHWNYAKFLKKTQRQTDALAQLKQLLSYHPHYIPAIVSAQKF